LAKRPLSELKQKVLAYKVAVDLWPVEDKRFIMNPTKWFSSGQYDSDPAIWIRTSSDKTPKASFA